MTQIILTIFMGAITGWIYRLLNGKHEKLDIVDHLLLGIMGALVGLVGYRLYFNSTIGGQEFFSLTLSLITASVFLAIGRNFTKLFKLPSNIIFRR